MVLHGPDPHAVVLCAKNDQRVFGRAPRYYGGRADEELCYEMGRWVAATYRWAYKLWERHGKRKGR